MARPRKQRGAGVGGVSLGEIVAAHRRGDLDAAERGYRAILRRSPKHPDALNLLGLVTLQRGQPREAEQLIRRAIAITPTQAGFHNNLGEALRATGDLAGALAAYLEAVRLAPEFAQGWGNVALCQLAAGRPQEAAQSASRAVSLAPRAAEAHNVLGLVEKATGRLAPAIAAFQAALAVAPGNPQALGNLADTLREAGRFGEAAAVCRQLAEQTPTDAKLWWLLAENLRAAGDNEAAAEAARRSMELAPEALEPVLTLEVALRAEGRIAESADCLRAALRIAPGRAATHNNLGMSLMALGERGEARACFERALELEPSLAPAWENLARCGRFEPETAATLPTRAEQRLALTPADDAAAPHLHFAAARWHDAAGATQAAISHYRQANRAARRRRHWDADAHSALVDRLIETFDARMFETAVPPPADADVTLPLLVVGMPRSGTTLIEQILASHPGVYGAGELNLLAGYIERLPGMLDDSPWPQCARLLDAPKRADLARVYCTRLRSLAPSAQRVTDKMPSNFLHLGLLALMLPGARVACCVREPRDTAVSVLMQHFEGGHAWAYDSYEIGRFQADHDRLMAHWRRVLPLDLHAVVYEDLVAAPADHIRALVAWAGLDWEDACLAFHRTRRVVRTASQAQVREPLHADSVGRWRRHAALLDAGFDAGLARLPRPPDGGANGAG